MKRFLLFCFSIGLYSCIWGQTELNPCGTVATKSAWLKKYQKNPKAYAKNFNDMLYVPMTIHVLGSDNATTFFKVSKILNGLCGLNRDFEEANIQFYIDGEIRFVASTQWNSHDSLMSGIDMMFANNIENTLNNYIVSNPANNAGYNLPYAGIALAKGTVNLNNHTWAHEIGHAFTLPHPFLGWEGGPNHNGDILQYNFNNPAPTEVYYDYTYFQDTLIRDTMIIDTALVEYLDGRNCNIAADGFCDTKPDYLAFRWSCNGDGFSVERQTDPAGEKFFSDGSLIMTYSGDNCQSRFSEEQIAAMRANLLDEKANLLRLSESDPLVVVEAMPLMVSPLSDETVQFDQAIFEWEEVENATAYLVQVSLLASFPEALTDEYLVKNNNVLTVENLFNNRRYHWRVRAFNRFSFCTAFSDVVPFQTGETTSTNEAALGLENLKVMPNVLRNGQGIQLELVANRSMELRTRLINVSGQQIIGKFFQVQSGMNLLELHGLENAANGIYFLEFLNELGRHVEKIIVKD